MRKKWVHGKTLGYAVLMAACGGWLLTAADGWQAVAEPAYQMNELLARAGLAEQWEKEEQPVMENLSEELLEELFGEDEMSEMAEAEREEGGMGDADREAEAEGAAAAAEGRAEAEPEPPKWRDPSEVAYTAVEDDYFQDALFIGDSRTVGMFEYGGLEETADFFASTGLTVFKLFESKVEVAGSSTDKITIEEALGQTQYKKIYLMLGINEMGRGDLESFLEQYTLVLNHLKEVQPEAIIYIQGIIKVTGERSGQGDYITNEGIEERNAGIASLANNVDIYYLDVNPVICDETGAMNPEFTTDGVHLKARYIPLWKDFLKQHAVVLD